MVFVTFSPKTTYYYHIVYTIGIPHSTQNNKDKGQNRRHITANNIENPLPLWAEGLGRNTPVGIAKNQGIDPCFFNRTNLILTITWYLLYISILISYKISIIRVSCYLHTNVHLSRARGSPD